MYINTSINAIKIPRKFSNSTPNEDKMESCRRFYKANGILDRDIIVDENMELKDGYIGYLVLKESNASVVGVDQRTTEKTVIVYGVHPGVAKEYCWKVVEETEDKQNLRVGAHAVVRTRFGDTEILITKIEHITKGKKRPMGHVKRVVRCLME